MKVDNKKMLKEVFILFVQPSLMTRNDYICYTRNSFTLKTVLLHLVELNQLILQKTKSSSSLHSKGEIKLNLNLLLFLIFFAKMNDMSIPNW